MTDRIRGPDKRVEGSNWSRRVRSNRLNEERADDQLHLAEFEEFVRNEHEQREQRQRDTLELHDENPQEDAPPSDDAPVDALELHEESDEETPPSPEEEPPPPAEDAAPEDEDDHPHLDITV